jgi:uncharacterized membrane protein YedE/YeeE
MEKKPALNWKTGGVLLGLVFFIAVLLVKPIGVSTQFVVADAMIGDLVNPSLIEQTDEGITSTNAYLAKSDGKYARAAARPFNYGFVFVLTMMLGAFISARLRGGVDAGEKRLPEIWQASRGDTPMKRNALVFAAGFIVLYGARLAGGCTSGHMMSGMMQTSLSGYLFAAGAFAAAIPVSMIIHRRRS